MSTDELIAEALRLPEKERARFVEELLSSLSSKQEVAHAWVEELIRRSGNLASGKARIVRDTVTGLPALSAGPKAPKLTSAEVREILADFP